MTKTQAGVLWCVSLAVFLALNPIAGMEQRDWQEVVLMWGGVTAAVVALAGALPPAALAVWMVIEAALNRTPGSLAVVFMLLAVLGVYALARRGPAAQIIRVVVALNVAVIALQAVGAWEPLLRLAFPAARYEVWNAARPWAGLTMGTGDVGCVLAMGLPFLLSGRALWLLPLAVAALLSTSALSAIVAGMAGLGVALFPRVRSWWAASGDWRIAYAGLALMATGAACEASEITLAVSDERWKVWYATAEKWLMMAPMAGFGLGSFKAAGVIAVDNATGKAGLWQQLHFDLLQFGFEAGLVGVALATWAFVWACRRASAAGNHAALGGLAALAVCQFGHFPLHLATAGIVAALVVGDATHE